jgi:GNAT superfamily N-acetyltransferase
MASSADTSIVVRAAVPADDPAVLGLLAASLGWSSDDHFQAFFRWKHAENPFGPSPGWVALDGEEVVGFRTFLRWEHEGPDGAVHRAVRAVDTATRPSHQGLGIFRSLTLHALEDMASEGVAMVFNTPNDQSRPGYLKMGWTAVGRLPTSVRLTGPRSPWRMLRARVPAERWSTPTDVGTSAGEVLAQDRVGDLLRTLPAATRLRTHRTPEYLRWRYGFAPLAYRALARGDDLADGLAVFRLRRRGAALECALCEVLVPGEEPAAARALVRAVVRECGADYVIRVGGAPVDRLGFVRLPRQGPLLTWRPLGPGPVGDRLDRWDLTLGDVELF